MCNKHVFSRKNNGWLKDFPSFLYVNKLPILRALKCLSQETMSPTFANCNIRIPVFCFEIVLFSFLFFLFHNVS